LTKQNQKNLTGVTLSGYVRFVRQWYCLL